MKKSLIVIAAVGVLAVLVIYQQSKISGLKEQLAEKPEAAAAAAKADAPAIAVEPETHRPVPAPEEESAPAVVATAKPATTAGSPAAPKDNMRDLFAGIGSMLTNPAMKEMIRAQSKMQLDSQYERLFKFLNKPAATTDALKELLMDRQMAMMDGGMAFMSGNASPEERKKQALQIKATQEAFDKKIADLLGPDDYDVYKQYESTQPERMQVDMFKHSLSSSGEPLSEQQEYDLVNAMYSIRTNAPLMNKLMKQDEVPDPSQFTEAGMKQMLESTEKMQQQYAAVATMILSPAQNEQFKKFSEQQKAMNELGMKFAAQMFGGGSNAAPVNVSVGTSVIVAP